MAFCLTVRKFVHAWPKTKIMPSRTLLNKAINFLKNSWLAFMASLHINQYLGARSQLAFSRQLANLRFAVCARYICLKEALAILRKYIRLSHINGTYQYPLQCSDEVCTLRDCVTKLEIFNQGQCLQSAAFPLYA